MSVTFGSIKLRSKKALYNISASLIYQIVALICGLITPKLILDAFGSSYNGVVSSATQFLSMISILTLGIAGATRMSLYKTLAAKDTDGTSRIVKATQRYMRKVALGLVIYAGVLMLIYPFISKNDLSHLECAILIGIISLGSFLEYFFGSAYGSLLMADQSEYITSFFRIMATILNTVFVFILIKLGADIFLVKLASAIAFAITPIGLSIVVRYRYRLNLKCKADMSVLSQRGSVAAHSIANIVHDNTDIVLLTLFLDAKEISVYTVYYLVIGKIKMLMRVFTSGLEAAFGNMWAKGETETLKRRFRTLEFSMFSFAMVIFSCVGILIVDFVTLYTNSVTDVNYTRPALAVTITFAEAFFCIRQPYLTLVQATGHYKDTRNGAILEAIINIVVSLSLVWWIGIEGVIVGTLVANIIRTTQYALFSSKKILQRSLVPIGLRLLVLGGSCTAIVALSRLAISRLEMTSWGMWILEGFIVFAIACGIWLISSLLFYRRDLFDLVAFGKRAIQRKTKIRPQAAGTEPIQGEKSNSSQEDTTI